MKYYYLKVGMKNCLAKQWIVDRRHPGDVTQSAVVVFFGKADKDHAYSKKRYSSEEYEGMGLSKRGRYQLNQLQFFYEACERKNRKDARFVVLCDERLFLLKPVSEVVIDSEMRPDHYERTFNASTQSPKYAYVKIDKELSVEQLPLLLAGITGNQKYNRGTIKLIGVTDACKYALDVLSGKIADHADILDLLAPVEYETLIAKIFEAYGCYVSAYRGGSMKGIDLIVHNKSQLTIDVCGIKIPQRRDVKIQVKAKNEAFAGNPRVVYVSRSADCCLEDNHYGVKWIKKVMQSKKCKTVRQWLEYAFDWAGHGKGMKIVDAWLEKIE